MKFRLAAVKHLQKISINDYSLNIISSTGWLALFACAIALVSVFFWSLFGQINTQVMGKAIILVHNGKIFNVVAPVDNSKVLEVKATIGKACQKDDILVELEHNELATQIGVSEIYIKQLNEEYVRLQTQSNQDLSDLQIILNEKENLFNKIVVIEKTSINFLEDLASKQNEMMVKGLANRLEYSRVLLDLTNSKAALENSYNQLLEIKLQLNNKKILWQERLRDLQLSIQNEQYKLNSLKEKYHTSKKLKSPIDGVVISVQSSTGEIINSGQSIVNIATLGEGLDAIAYFLPEKGKKIKKGMKALVSPSNIKPEEHGSLIGEVIEVATFPTNNKEMMSILKNENLVKALAQDQAPIMVYIRIQEDKNNFSGFKWSSSKGPNEKITPGTLAEVKVIVKKQKPITLLIPSIKKLFM